MTKNVPLHYQGQTLREFEALVVRTSIHLDLVVVVVVVVVVDDDSILQERSVRCGGGYCASESVASPPPPHTSSSCMLHLEHGVEGRLQECSREGEIF